MGVWVYGGRRGRREKREKGWVYDATVSHLKFSDNRRRALAFSFVVLCRRPRFARAVRSLGEEIA